LLLKRLYPEIGQLNSTSSAFLMAFFKRGLTATDSSFYSHAIRWNNAARLQRFMLEPAADSKHLEEELILIPRGFEAWSHFGQAQYLEIITFLSPYLLSSQGDRVAMGHSVEGRYPFLDYRMVEFCGQLPAKYKMRGLREKWLLRQVGRKLLPPEIWTRRKRPYRAPIQRSFFGPETTTAYAQELLTERAIQDTGLFNPQAVAQLVRKAVSGAQLSEVDDMAVAGILSTQLVYQQFVKDFNVRLSELRPGDRVKVVHPTHEETVS
jgi:asparagine synthase (glutamine-hydrolysing)